MEEHTSKSITYNVVSCPQDYDNLKLIWYTNQENKNHISSATSAKTCPVIYNQSLSRKNNNHLDLSSNENQLQQNGNHQTQQHVGQQSLQSNNYQPQYNRNYSS